VLGPEFPARSRSAGQILRSPARGLRSTGYSNNIVLTHLAFVSRAKVSPCPQRNFCRTRRIAGGRTSPLPDSEEPTSRANSAMEPRWFSMRSMSFILLSHRYRESLERLFRVRIQVNAYAGWRTSHGFDLHWDDHDVFILQVAGRKQWKVYGMTRKYPMARDIEPTTEKPDTPLWEGMLNDGDMLYIPRGWWHVATPLDEPTLHLTVGVNNPTGADLLSWFVDKLRAREEVRRDLPFFGDPEQQARLLERLRELFLDEWKPDLMQQYLLDLDNKSQPRTRLNLPWGATPDALPPDGGPLHVRWASARRPHIEQAGAEIHVVANGRRWRFASAAAPMLETLSSGEICSVAELSGLDPATMRTFIRELVINGLIVVV
jgi:hypothetical protein